MKRSSAILKTVSIGRTRRLKALGGQRVASKRRDKRLKNLIVGALIAVLVGYIVPRIPVSNLAGSFDSLRQSLPTVSVPSFSSIIDSSVVDSSEEGFVLSVNSPKRLTAPLIPGSTRVSTEHFTINHKVRRGETLSSILGGYGFPRVTSHQLYNAMKKAAKEHSFSHRIKTGQLLEFVYGSDASIETMRTKIDLERELLLHQDGKEGKYSAVVESNKAREQERIAIGIVDSSFAAAAKDAGISYDTVDDLVDIFSDRVSFSRDFRKGDRFTLIYKEKRYEAGSMPGPILAAALRVNDKDFYAVQYIGKDGKSRYFNEKGELIGDGFLRYPVKFSRISSHFSRARFHPVLKVKRPHNGVDFAAPRGTPVRTVADGKVVFAGRKGGAGIMVKIKHSSRYSTAYLHLSKIAKGIRPGTRVARGQLIGNVGSTGWATGPHLHYSFYDKGRYVDPLKIKLPVLDSLSRGTKIAKSRLERVLYTLKHYQVLERENFYWNS